MHIAATITNHRQQQDIVVKTAGNSKSISIPAKPEGQGSSVNGGELLFLSLATCFCNDLYREAAKMKIDMETVTVTVEGEFGNEGEPATSIRYKVAVVSDAAPDEIAALIKYTDTIAEVHNTLRRGIHVQLVKAG
jgi:uncharacterized OsmC-like protein